MLESTHSIEDKSQWPENFIVKTFMIASGMEDKAEKYLKSSNEREKDLEETWKATNQKKQKKQQELAANYKIMAYTSTALMVVSMATTVGGAIVNAHPGLDDVTKRAADLLSSVGDKASSFGSKIADNVSSSTSQNTNALIEELSQNAQKVWEQDKRTNETRKEELKNLKEKLSGATRDATDKVGAAYTVRA